MNNILGGSVGQLSYIVPSKYCHYFEPLYGNTNNAYGECYYYKKNGIVHVHLAIEGLTENYLDYIYYLPEGFRPMGPIYVICAGTGSDRNRGHCIVYPNGGISVQPSNNTHLFADIRYDAYG